MVRSHDHVTTLLTMIRARRAVDKLSVWRRRNREWRHLSCWSRRRSENFGLAVLSGYSKAQCTPHGFRSSFRDRTAEETTFPSEVVEMPLAHKIKNKVEAVYRRGNLLA